MGHLIDQRTYSRELVTCVTYKHTGLAYSPISDSNTLDKPWSAWSHWCKQTKLFSPRKRTKILAVEVKRSERLKVNKKQKTKDQKKNKRQRERGEGGLL